MKKIKNYFKRIYRLTLSFKRQEELVWKEIKALHADLGWKYMINEKENHEPKVPSTALSNVADEIC